jgi:hypothetical protein
MRKRKLLVALAALLAFALLLYGSWPSSNARENFNRVEVGMTEDEAIAILGPPGDYRNAENECDRSPAHQPLEVFGRGNPQRHLPHLWRSDTADVALNFDDSAKVSGGLECRRCQYPESESQMARYLRCVSFAAPVLRANFSRNSALRH